MREMIRKNRRTFGRYAIVSGVSFVTNIGLTAFLHEIVSIGEELSYGIALITVFLINFSAMRFYVYGHLRNKPGAAGQMAKTAAASLMFRLLEFTAFFLLHTVIGIYYLLAILVVMSISFMLKFFVYDKFIFAPASHRSAL